VPAHAGDESGTATKSQTDKKGDDPAGLGATQAHSKTSDVDDATTAAKPDKADKSDSKKSTDNGDAGTPTAATDPNAGTAAPAVAATALVTTAVPVATVTLVTAATVTGFTPASATTSVDATAQAQQATAKNGATAVVGVQQSATAGALTAAKQAGAKSAAAGGGKVGDKTIASGDAVTDSDTAETTDAAAGIAVPVKGSGTAAGTANKAKEAQGVAQTVQDAAADPSAASASPEDGSVTALTPGQSDGSGDATKIGSLAAKPQGAQTATSGPDATAAHDKAADKLDANSASAKDANAALPNGGDATAQGLTANANGPQTTAPSQSVSPQDKSAQAAATTLTVPVQGVAVAITVQAQAGNSHFDIRLDPPELGKIEVHLNMHDDGRVTSHLVVDRPETLDLLKRDAPALQRTLQDAGFKTSGNGLQFSLRDQSGSNQNQYHQPDRSPRPTAPQIAASISTSIPTQTVSRQRLMASLRGGLDIQV
jgi:flagellar hook-length control protein FliK